MAGGGSSPCDAGRRGGDLASDLGADLSDFLVAALVVGIAGGSFAVGIAYVSRLFPQAKQGTALGIFGAGNVGAAVTKFVAPFVHGRLRLADRGAGLGAGPRR